MLTRESVQLASVLTEMYENYMVREGTESDKRRKYDHFHPSSFGQCLRKTAFQFYGVPRDEELEPRVRRIFAAGHAHHHRMQTDFSKMGILRGYWKCLRCHKIHGKDEKWGVFMPVKCSCDKLLPDDFPTRKLYGDSLFEYEEITVKDAEHGFEGHCDGIIELVKDEEDSRYVIDFKTVNGEKFKFLKSPDPVYVTQIRIYMWILGISQGIIFYEEKNTHEIKEYHIYQDENHIAEIRNSAKKLQEILKLEKIPSIPKIYAKDKKPCMYCEFKKKCWSKKEKS